MAVTRLLVALAAFPEGMRGGPEDWARAVASRLIITWPFGATQIQVGGLEPTTNIGLWLKDGTKPYVWSNSEAKYVPADVSDSLVDPFWYGSSTPAGVTPKVWLRTYDTGKRARWFHYNGTAWEPEMLFPNSGTTAQRPVIPQDLEQYWDTTINSLIHWERSQWRTVGGTPGDIKQVDTGDVDYATAVTNALARNPGWSEIDAAFRGRALAVAGSGAGLTVRAPKAVDGVETVVLSTAQIPAHAHTGLSILRSSNVNGGGPATNGVMCGDTAAAGISLFSTSYTANEGGGTAHTNVQPSAWFVTLRKD